MQLNLEGKTKDQVSIERIKAFEPADGYILAFSGGRDSIILKDLAIRAESKFKAQYKWTTVDPPQVVRFVKEVHPDVEIIKPQKTMWEIIEENGVFPQRQRRFCCRILKENNPPNSTILTGVRWEEGTNRASRRMFEVCRKDKTVKYLHPIIDWTEQEEWYYIKQERHLPYCNLYDIGFKRIGCILCPMVSGWQLDLQIRTFPKSVIAWRNAARRLYAQGKITEQQSGDEYFKWWLAREGHTEDDNQCAMFHD